MRKKILYSILFLTLFLISTASMIQPVTGYERGLPDEGIGVEQISEVKIFNEDEWEKCMGKGAAGPDAYYSGDADVVGARQLTIFREYFDDEEKNLQKKQLARGTALEVMNLGFRQAIAELLYPTGDVLNVTWPDATKTVGYCGQAPALVAMPVGAVTQAWPMALGPTADPVLNGSIQQLAGAVAMGPLPSMADLLNLYTKKYEMSYLTRDKWNFNEDWETDEDFGDPDKADLEYDHKHDGWGPIVMDPDELVEMLGALQNIYYASKQAIAEFHVTAMTPFNYFSATGTFPGPFTAQTLGNYTALNQSLYMAAGPAGPDMLDASPKTNWTAMGGNDNIHGDLVMLVFAGLDAMISSFYYILDLMPFTNPTFMIINLGIGGLPIGVPADDFMTKVLDELNLKDDILYPVPLAMYGKDLPTDTASCPGGETVSPIAYGKTSLHLGAPLGGETVTPMAYYDVKYDGGTTLTVEIEWPDDTIDPKDMLIFGGDGEDELKDFEVQLVVAEAGALGAPTWTRGDTIIWQMGGVDQIPGYEITILLGVSAISVLALVYVIMKKRKR